RGSHSPGPETCRASGSGASEVRAGDQSQNRKHARPEPASDRARSRRRGDRMKRREFITLVGGVVTWPVMARGQQSERMRRVGVLQVQPETDADFRSWRMLFAARLRELGWINGKNLQIDYRYGVGDAASIAPVAKELIDLHPEALFAITAVAA